MGSAGLDFLPEPCGLDTGQDDVHDRGLSNMSAPSINVAVAVVHKNGLWLVAKRHPHVHLGGKWEFPGGKSEPGETAEQTALRELEEECAVHAAIDHKLDTLRCDYGDRIVHLTPVICHWRSGQPKSIACAETAWVTLEQLARLDMPALNASILQALADATQ